MAVQSFAVNTRYRLLCLLLCIACPAVRAVACPPSCICVFDNVLEDNTASCEFGNSTLEVAWYKDYGHPVLKLTCKDAYEGLKYDCNNFPQFNIRHNAAWVSVHSCPSSIIACATRPLLSSSKVLKLETDRLVGQYESQDFSEMQHVMRLKINLLSKDHFKPEVINDMKWLTQCLITGGNLDLSPNVFQQETLEDLQLYENSIVDLPPDTFKNLPNLTFLEIRQNFLEHLLPKNFQGLDALETLVLEKNHIYTIEPNTFFSMKQLTNLYIKNNKIKLVSNGLFEGMDRLYKIGFTMNRVQMELDTHAFADLPATFRILDMSTNKIRNLPELLLNGSSSIHQLYFNRNQIESLPPKLLVTNTELRYVDFSKNRIEKLPDNFFSTTKKLIYINFSHNYIFTLKGDIFAHIPALKEIFLDHNLISNIDQDVFKGTHLRTVNLAHNSLQLIADDMLSDWSTKKLNFSHNKLSVFEDWFVQMSGLESLDLSNNKIGLIQETVIYNKSNITVDLRSNDITSIVRDMKLTPTANPPGDITIYLANNSLNCDCHNLALLQQWNKYHILVDFENITCSNSEKLTTFVPCTYNPNCECLHTSRDKKSTSLSTFIVPGVISAVIITSMLIAVYKHFKKLHKRKNIEQNAYLKQ